MLADSSKGGGGRMCNDRYEFTELDLNPRFLYSCILERGEEERLYQAHDFVELAVILGGSGNFLLDGETVPVREGDLVLLNPGTYHKSLLVSTPKQKAIEGYLAFTDVQYQDCPKNSLPLFSGNERIFHMPESMKKEILRLLKSMDQEVRTPRLGQYSMLKAYLIQLLCLIARENMQKEEAKEPLGRFTFRSPNKKYAVRQIEQYLQEHYREKISLEQIASNMYLSSFYISKIFKSETGDSPINYLIGIRMEKAKELLTEHPDASLQEVAVRVGYDDVYHFSKLFKKYYGISPGHYKSKTNR